MLTSSRGHAGEAHTPHPHTSHDNVTPRHAPPTQLTRAVASSHPHTTRLTGDAHAHTSLRASLRTAHRRRLSLSSSSSRSVSAVRRRLTHSNIDLPRARPFVLRATARQGVGSAHLSRFARSYAVPTTAPPNRPSSARVPGRSRPASEPTSLVAPASATFPPSPIAFLVCAARADREPARRMHARRPTRDSPSACGHHCGGPSEEAFATPHSLSCHL